MDSMIARAWSARRDGRLQEADTVLREVIRQACDAGNGSLLARALGKLAHIERDRGRHAEAGALYEQAVPIARETGDTALLASVVRHHADLHRQTGHPEAAEQGYREALFLYRSMPEPPALDVANALRALALQCRDAGYTKEAERLWIEARPLYEAEGIGAGVEECDAHISRQDPTPG